jgi:hypothetical protein
VSIDEIMMNRIWKQRDDLVEENQRLQERIKRLEEAGDALGNNHNLFTYIDWLKAKEAK